MAFIQKKTGGGAGVNSFALTFDANTVADNFLAALYSAFLSGGGPPNNAPTGGGTWFTTVAPTSQNSGNAFICYAPRATGGATTVTVDYGTGFFIEGVVAEFNKINLWPLHQEASNSNAASSTPTSGTTLITESDRQLVLVCCAVTASEVDIGIDVPATTGYTNLHVQQNANDTNGISADYKYVDSRATQSGAWGTLNVAAPWSAKIATFWITEVKSKFNKYFSLLTQRAYPSGFRSWLNVTAWW